MRIDDGKDIQENNIAGILADHENERIFVFTKDMVINQLQRESPAVAASFDSIYGEEFNKLSEELSFILTLLANGQRKAIVDKDDIVETCGILLQNAINSIIASIQLLRSGFRLQSGILIRNVIETCAVIFHLLSRPEDLQRFRDGKFESTRAISTAQKMLPIFGRYWSLLSGQFNHISNLYSDWHPLYEYKDRNDQAATTTLGILGVAVWFIKMTTELTFINYIDKPQHWEFVGDGRTKFIPPNNEEMAWIKKVFDE